MKKLVLILVLYAPSVALRAMAGRSSAPAMSALGNLLTGLRNMWKSPNQALMEAARAGDLSRVQDALNRGADVNHADNGGWTPLYIAAERGHHAVIQLLIERNANIDIAHRRAVINAVFGLVRPEGALLLCQAAEENARRKLPSRIKGIPTGE